jgi:hypothetical protein
MKVARRRILQVSGIIAGALPLVGCEQVISNVADRLENPIPDKTLVSSNAEIDPDFHLLSRATFGPRPGDLAYLKKIGKEAWLKEQLHPEGIDDRAGNLRSRRFETIEMEAGDCCEFKREVLRRDLSRHALLKAVYSKRQLFEVMVSFWSDHLNINIEKGDCMYYKAADDRLVIRKNALGKFQDLIRASATSPAMLVYLDGDHNKKEKPEDIPNENYARELLELHTMGVHGGYTQRDVFEVARCLTGWRVHDKWQRGKVFFDPAWHDDGEKKVLGHVIPAHGGQNDLDKVIELACKHPATAQHVATKLVRRFVADKPPPTLVASVAKTFTRTDGDIKECLLTLFNSKEFDESRGCKIKRPFQFIASTLRAMAADTHAHDPLIEYLTRMGQGPFQYPTPDGYPDRGEAWVATLLWRWNFALALINNDVPSVKVSLEKLARSTGALKGDTADPAKLMAHFLGRGPNATEKRALDIYVLQKAGSQSKESLEKARTDSGLVALMLASPAFQRC